MFWKNIFKKKLPLSTIDYDFYFNTSKHGDIELSVLELGLLNLTTGKIIVCDPLVFLEHTSPMIKEVTPGQYPVKISVAKHTEMGERYALAKLEITKQETVKWELAITQDVENKINELKGDAYFGFPVDAGLGCFCDLQAQEAYSKFMNEFYGSNPNANIYDDYFAEQFKKNAKNQNDVNDIGDWLNYSVPESKNNIIMFHSGFGDGYYPVYWGYDANNNLTSLMIDFQVFGDE
ncbi:MAG: DUF4241 domain-containing protein [Aquirhabdus sp.]